MNRETIEKAADEFAEREYETNVIDRDYLHKGFYHGAHWRINSVWHDCQKELPERENEWILLEAVINDKTIYLPVEWVNDGKGATKYITRWAYVSDLLPDRKEVRNESK